MSFTLFPAIDLKHGEVVRLRRGAMDQATVYDADPAARARAFHAAGFAHLHVVDLDGAFAGRPANREAVEAVLRATPLSVQVGGGIRDMATAAGWLEAGIARVILGSAAARDPDFTREACRAFPGRVVLGIDARGGMVATEGWAETTDISATDLALRYEDAGAAAIIYTDIDRDGMLGGVNVDSTVALARAVRMPVIASGGVASIEDIRALRAVAQEGVSGVIIGRALYDGTVDPQAALALAAN